MSAKQVILIGAGGHARALIGLLNSANINVAYVVDEKARPGEAIGTVPVLKVLPEDQCPLILAIGDSHHRERQFSYHKNRLYLPALVHPAAFTDCESTIGDAVQVFAGAYLGPFCHIDDNCIINTHAIIEHEAKVGAHSHIAVGAKLLGRSRVGARCFIGANAVIKDNVSTCDDVIVGANAFVNTSITEPGVYVGTPARRVK